jgi:hypothetical protein
MNVVEAVVLLNAEDVGRVVSEETVLEDVVLDELVLDVDVELLAEERLNEAMMRWW